MNDIQDKQYLALELVKLAYPSNSVWGDDEIFNSYKKQLERLTGLTQDLETMKSLQEEVERLQQKLNEKINNDNPLESLKSYRLIQIINDGKGDMEPYLYDAIMKIIGE